MSSCFAVLRQLRSIRRSVSPAALVALVLSRLDYGSATLAGLPNNQLDRLQSVLNAAARLLFSARKYEHVTQFLRDLHWLLVFQRVEYKLAMLVYRCLHGLAPSYLADDLQLVADLESKQRLRSSSSDALVVPSSRLCTVGDRAFPVSAARLWNGLPAHVTSSPSLHILKRHLKTFLFSRNFPSTDSQ